jgi:chromosome condensin MukBEF complex kleisin-like MukF subunit
MIVQEAVAQAFRSGMQLHVNREDMAFVAGIATDLEIRQGFSLDQAALEKVYAIVNELTCGNEETVSQRAARSVERLVKNRLLIRVDGGGLSYRPQYDLTQLGKAVVRFLAQNETLTRQNLTVITARIVAILADIRQALASSGTDRFWDERVRLPLSTVVGELLEAIDKRRRGLDQAQNEVRSDIGRLLEKNWLEALKACEELLKTTSDALQELYHTILAENTAIRQGLNEIAEQADNSAQTHTLDVIDAIHHRLDQMEQWGRERVGSWSQYFRRVNDFLQSIVRFDPNRDLSRRLTQQLQVYPENPWYLRIIHPTRYRTIREINLAADKTRVVRSLTDSPVDDDLLDDDGNQLLDRMVDDLKSRLKQDSSLDLVELLRPYLQAYPLTAVYPHIGTLIDLILLESATRPEINFDWEQPLPEVALELQNLRIRSHDPSPH